MGESSAIRLNPIVSDFIRRVPILVTAPSLSRLTSPTCTLTRRAVYAARSTSSLHLRCSISPTQPQRISITPNCSADVPEVGFGEGHNIARPRRCNFAPSSFTRNQKLPRPRFSPRAKTRCWSQYGQVIRTGILQERVFNDAFNFKLSLRFIRNPNMAANGRFPTAVGDF